MGLELEQDKRPTVRPWKLPLKAKMESLGDPEEERKKIHEIFLDLFSVKSISRNTIGKIIYLEIGLTW